MPVFEPRPEEGADEQTWTGPIGVLAEPANIGLKMVWLNDAFGGKFPITWSLGPSAGAKTVSAS